MEGTSSDTGRKIYPKRTRITREDTVTNILNLLDDNNEDALSSSDQESGDENEETSTSSESEYEENENTVFIEEVFIEQVVHNEVPLEKLDNTNNDYENTEVGSKKKRGRPKDPQLQIRINKEDNLMKTLTNGMKWLAIIIYVYMNSDLFLQKNLEFRLNLMNLLLY